MTVSNSKITKRVLCILLAFALAFPFAVCTGAQAGEEYSAYWSENTCEIQAGLAISPGADDSEHNFSWFSQSGTGDVQVKLSTNEDMSDCTVFKGEQVENMQGDYSNRVTVSGLENGKTYYYQAGDGTDFLPVRSFKTDDSSSFSAIYLTDIHISDESWRGKEDGENRIVEQSEKYNEVISAATGINPGISLILTGGDNASGGFREEYLGLFAAPAAQGIPLAPAFGNHDRKNVDFKYSFNLPNESRNAFIKDYAAGDYWYVKGDVLFFVFDSNSANMVAHEKVFRQAIDANPDVKWRIVTMHHDLYSGRKPSREDENKLLRLIWVPMFDKYNIDLVLMGHSHYYSVSDVLYDGQTAVKTGQNSVIDNAAGTVYFVSGSINRPVSYADDVPLSDKIGFAYLPEETATIFNIIDFTPGSLKLSSYTLETGECFNTLTLNKTDAKGGHPSTGTKWYYPAIKFLSSVYGFFNNMSPYKNNEAYMPESLSRFEFMLGVLGF